MILASYKFSSKSVNKRIQVVLYDLWITFEIILHLIKNLRHILYFFSYQNRFINECARKKKAKIP